MARYPLARRTSPVSMNGSPGGGKIPASSSMKATPEDKAAVMMKPARIGSIRRFMVASLSVSLLVFKGIADNRALGCLPDVCGHFGNFKDRPYFDDGAALYLHRRAPLGPLDGFFFRLHVDHPVSADDLFCFHEGTVRHGRFSVLE